MLALVKLGIRYFPIRTPSSNAARAAPRLGVLALVPVPTRNSCSIVAGNQTRSERLDPALRLAELARVHLRGVDLPIPDSRG
jgi:hypothetical protein